MVLHKFALPGGKVSAATGMRAAGRPPKAGRRTSFAAAAAPPGLRPAGCPPKTLPHRAQQFSVYFLSEGVRFLRLMFFRRPSVFCGGDRKSSPHPRKAKQPGGFYPPLSLADFGPLRWGRIVPIPARANQWIVFIHPRRLSILGFCSGEEWFPSPQGKAIGSFLTTLAACRFWAFAVGRNSSHPRKGKPMGRFYPPSPPVNFGLLQWGRKVSIPARARQTDSFFIPYRPVLPTAG